MDEDLKRRRQWSEVRPDEELDHRHTRELKAKHYKFNITMSPVLFMQMDAAPKIGLRERHVEVALYRLQYRPLLSQELAGVVRKRRIIALQGGFNVPRNRSDFQFRICTK